MAIQANIDTSTGPVATYHRIGHIRIGCANKIAAAVLLSYWDQASRDAGLGTLGQAEWLGAQANFPFTDEQLASVRAALEASDSADLMQLDLVYDKPGIACTATYSQNVMGVDTTWQQSYPWVSKDVFPEDFLAIIYPLLAEYEFSDGRQVRAAHLASGSQV